MSLVGTLTEITPAGLTAGIEDATRETVSGQQILKEATTWILDTFGQDAVACSVADGRLYYWTKATAGLAALIAEAPTGCSAVVVTPERFIVALGAGGDSRKVQWADQESVTDWTPTVENQAGDFIIASPGRIMAGKRSRGETLIWTDADLHAMRYIGGEFVYSFSLAGSQCGVVSRQGMQVVDGKAFWMGSRAFYQYDGFVQSLASEVGDYVFNDLNRDQISKVVCTSRSEFGEVTWYYPSGNATENDRYVTYNWREGHWAIGLLERTSDIDRGAFPFPLATDRGGRLYRHEQGTSYLNPAGAALVPFAESGPVEIGSGQQVMHVLGIVPDEVTIGSVLMSLFTRDYPTAAETTHGPYAASQPVHTRIAGRQVRIRLVQGAAGWRFGTPRLDVYPGGRR